MLIHTTILGLVCMALASEMDLEPEQYSSQLADMMQNHRLEARSDPRAASHQRVQQNRHSDIFSYIHSVKIRKQM